VGVGEVSFQPQGSPVFAGRVLTAHRQAHDLIANPLLQIYSGRAMTCAFDPAKASARCVPTTAPPML
jgi:hypothetical protein